jgi:hypothetical protein
MSHLKRNKRNVFASLFNCFTLKLLADFLFGSVNADREKCIRTDIYD